MYFRPILHLKNEPAASQLCGSCYLGYTCVWPVANPIQKWKVKVNLLIHLFLLQQVHSISLQVTITDNNVTSRLWLCTFNSSHPLTCRTLCFITAVHICVHIGKAKPTFLYTKMNSLPLSNPFKQVLFSTEFKIIFTSYTEKGMKIFCMSFISFISKSPGGESYCQGGLRETKKHGEW